MNEKTIDVSPYKYVREAISAAQFLAKADSCKVLFRFNGVLVTVLPDSEFNSVLRTYLKDSNDLQMANIRGKSEAVQAPAVALSAKPAASPQEELDRLVKSINDYMGASWDVLIFMSSYVIAARREEVRNNHALTVYNRLMEEGYHENMFNGSTNTWSDPTKSAAFIVGKAMLALAKKEVPDPVILEFISMWSAKHAGSKK